MDLEKLKTMLAEKERLFEDFKGQTNAVAGQIVLIKDMIKELEKPK